MADSWERVGSMFALNGICHAPEHVYLARGLHPSGVPVEQEVEGITAVRRVPWARVLELVADGTITDGETVAALMYAALAWAASAESSGDAERRPDDRRRRQTQGGPPEDAAREVAAVARARAVVAAPQRCGCPPDGRAELADTLVEREGRVDDRGRGWPWSAPGGCTWTDDRG